MDEQLAATWINAFIHKGTPSMNEPQPRTDPDVAASDPSIVGLALEVGYSLVQKDDRALGFFERRVIPTALQPLRVLCLQVLQSAAALGRKYILRGGPPGDVGRKDLARLAVEVYQAPTQLTVLRLLPGLVVPSVRRDAQGVLNFLAAVIGLRDRLRLVAEHPDRPDLVATFFAHLPRPAGGTELTALNVFALLTSIASAAKDAIAYAAPAVAAPAAWFEEGIHGPAAAALRGTVSLTALQPVFEQPAGLPADAAPDEPDVSSAERPERDDGPRTFPPEMVGLVTRGGPAPAAA